MIKVYVGPMSSNKKEFFNVAQDSARIEKTPSGLVRIYLDHNNWIEVDKETLKLSLEKLES